jgi:hypothetical protein
MMSGEPTTARASAARWRSPPDSSGGKRVGAGGEARPAEEVGHVLPPGRVVPAADGEGERHVFGERQVVEELAVLMHHADPLPRGGHAVPVDPARVLAEDVEAARGRLEREVAEPEERGLARPRRPREEVEGPRLERDGDA